MEAVIQRMKTKKRFCFVGEGGQSMAYQPNLACFCKVTWEHLLSSVFILSMVAFVLQGQSGIAHPQNHKT